ncbi:ARP7 protein [Gonium pectorale]|uniref:ARP7 protein n=1 Tax=Gonium pectorale TaxID=33097 RepID=A0A150GTU2_GONPE|nr:ARP7 protein [Gonium pectorale]|eukprot:KXZ53296.1 ARP7 protein [Gonium pectorale]
MADAVTVLDIGSRWIKAGWAYNQPTDGEPRILAPSAVYVDPSGPGADPGVSTSSAPGELQHPIRRGRIVSWDQFESLAYYVLYELMGWELGNEGNIMICEPVLTGRSDRETMAQLMFEVFNVTGIFCQDQAVLSLYAVGRTNGLVVDLGHDKIDVATVAEGMLIPSSVRRLDFGGANLTQYLQRLLQDPQRAQPQPDGAGGLHPTQPLSDDDAEALKALCARCAETRAGFTSAVESAAAETFRLPDGQEFTVAAEGLRVGEALFQPYELLGVRGPNIAEAACDSAACLHDALLRKVMFENMLVVGGGSVIPGVTQRFLSEARSLVPAAANAALTPIPEYMPSPNVTRDAAWVGGSVLAKVALLQNHFIVKAEYDEAGPGAVHRRCA